MFQDWPCPSCGTDHGLEQPDTVIAPLTTEVGLPPPAGTDTGNGAAAQPPTLAMCVTEIDVSELVIPRGPIAF